MKSDTLVETFLNEALIYSQAIPEGDHKKANKANKKMISLYKKIKTLDGIERLKIYLTHDNDGVRLCVASNLIKDFPELCLDILNAILVKDNTFSLLAKMGIDLYEKGKL